MQLVGDKSLFNPMCTMFSCSSDGAILNWTVLENCLVATLITVIPFTRQIKSEVGVTYVLIQLLSLTERNGTEHGRTNTLRYLCRFMVILFILKELKQAMTNGAKCLAFKPDDDSLFLVGTEV